MICNAESEAICVSVLPACAISSQANSAISWFRQYDFETVQNSVLVMSWCQGYRGASHICQPKRRPKLSYWNRTVVKCANCLLFYLLATVDVTSVALMSQKCKIKWLLSKLLWLLLHAYHNDKLITQLLAVMGKDSTNTCRFSVLAHLRCEIQYRWGHRGENPGGLCSSNLMQTAAYSQNRKRFSFVSAIDASLYVGRDVTVMSSRSCSRPTTVKRRCTNVAQLTLQRSLSS